MGLAGRPSSLAMIPVTSRCRPLPRKTRKSLCSTPGGTNFRTAIIRFDEESVPHQEYFTNTAMPGTDKEVTLEEFFGRIAESLLACAFRKQAAGVLLFLSRRHRPAARRHAPLLDKRDQGAGRGRPKNPRQPRGNAAGTKPPGARIHARPQRYGRVLMAGWRRKNFPCAITMPGLSSAPAPTPRTLSPTRSLQRERPDGLLTGGSQAINVESANFSRIKRGDIDVAFDKTTSSPGKYILEKMVSEANLGPLCHAALKTAATEGVVSPAAARFFEKSEVLQTKELDAMLDGSFTTLTKFSPLPRQDSSAIGSITSAIVERAAKLTAINLAAAILKSAGNGPAKKKCACPPTGACITSFVRSRRAPKSTSPGSSRRTASNTTLSRLTRRPSSAPRWQDSPDERRSGRRDYCFGICLTRNNLPNDTLSIAMAPI